MLVAALTLGSVSAYAQETVTTEGSGNLGRGLGIGIQAFLGGPAGLSITYDPGSFRIDGILAFALDSQEPDDVVNLVLAARAFVPLKETAVADFSIGGGFEMDYISAGDSDVDITIAALLQIRAFITTNVALSFTGGLGFVLDGDDGDSTVFLGGQLTANAGATFFF
jgi:hypothetical protein